MNSVTRTVAKGNLIQIVARQRLDIEGSHNLRDLGGITTTDGRKVRQGAVFRSGSLERLSTTGIGDLIALGIGTIFDLRSGPERAHSPTRWLADHDIAIWQLGDDESLGDPKPLLAQSLVSAEKTQALMRNVYRKLPTHHRESYTALFRALTHDEVPILVHCSAGKDRTGVATALLLALLGVDRAHIDTDYLATNSVIDVTTRMFLLDPRNADAFGAAPEAWRPMMTADTSYLDAMFDEIEQVLGSVEAFVQTQLDLSVSDIQRLRERLLE